jgi:hypothetical protein
MTPTKQIEQALTGAASPVRIFSPPKTPHRSERHFCSWDKEGSLDRSNNKAARVLPSAKQDGAPLPPSGGGGDPGHTLLRRVRPRAGGVLRDRHAYPGGAGPSQRAARRGESLREKGKVMAEDKSTSAESRLTREGIAPARPSSKEEYERILEWWEGYDPGMDADLLSRVESNSPRPLLWPRSL